MKKKSSLWSVLDMVKSYWPLLVVLFGIVGTIVTIPSRLKAVEERSEKVESRQATIEKYIEASEKEKQALEDNIKNAPLGWKWDIVDSQYIPYPNDPRLKKK